MIICRSLLQRSAVETGLSPSARYARWDREREVRLGLMITRWTGKASVGVILVIRRNCTVSVHTGFDSQPLPILKLAFDF